MPHARQKPLAIQLCRFSAELEAALTERLDLHALTAASAGKAPPGTLANAEFVLTSGKLGCESALIDRLPRLRMIAIHGVGYDRVDLDQAARRGVIVANTPGVLDDDVADLAVGLVIALLRGIPRADRFVRDGDWQSREMGLGSKVTGKRFGIVGLGRIGTAIARRLEAFGPIAYTGTCRKPVPWQWQSDVLALASSCDILIVSCAANDGTKGLIDDTVLHALGPGGVIVNISRGSVVREDALVAALSRGVIFGAALDVFAEEPVIPSELRRNERTVLTPHIGSATLETREAMARAMLASIDAVLRGRQPPGKIN